MPVLASLFFGFVPMFFFAYIIYWIDRYEKEPKILLGAVFLWGVVIAAGGAFIINTVLGLGVYIFTGSEAATDITTGSIIAPLVEESLKGLAVLVVFLLFRREFDSVLDGIVYASVAALGFAALENSYYIYTYGWQESGWEGFWFLVFVRVILVGWQHPFYTAFTGIGLALARLNRNTFAKLILPVLGYGVAVFAHSVHNTIATFAGGIEGLVFGTVLDWFGLFMMFCIILWATWYEKRYIKRHLVEEVKLGLISAAQYRTATSAWAQSFAGLTALFSGRYMATSRFYQACGELAHKKEQLQKLGDEGGNTATIARLRAELQGLAPRAQS
jgi:RsiW-degrading membrane proteinase PrsW (M82 family)